MTKRRPSNDPTDDNPATDVVRSSLSRYLDAHSHSAPDAAEEAPESVDETVHDRLDAVEQTSDNVRQTVHQMQPILRQIKRRTVTLQRSVESLESTSAESETVDLDPLSETIESTDEKLDRIIDSLVQLDHIAEDTAKIDEIAAETDRIWPVRRKLRGLQNRVDQSTRAVEEVSSTIDQLVSNDDAVDTRLTELQTHLAAVDSTITDIASEVAAIEPTKDQTDATASLESLGGEVEELTATLDSLGKSVEDLQEQQATVVDRLESLHAINETITAELHDVEHEEMGEAIESVAKHQAVQADVLDEVITELQTGNEAMLGEFHVMRTKVERLEKQTPRGTAADDYPIAAQLDQLQSTVTELASAQTKQFDTIDERLERLEDSNEIKQLLFEALTEPAEPQQPVSSDTMIERIQHISGRLDELRSEQDRTLEAEP